MTGPGMPESGNVQGLTMHGKHTNKGKKVNSGRTGNDYMTPAAPYI